MNTMPQREAVIVNLAERREQREQRTKAARERLTMELFNACMNCRWPLPACVAWQLPPKLLRAIEAVHVPDKQKRRLQGDGGRA